MFRSFLCIFSVFSVVGIVDLLAGSLKCDITAPIAILINAENGNVLYEKNARIKTYPASTTKVATALYGLKLKNQSLHNLVQVSHNSVAAVSPSIRRSGKHPSYRLEFGGSHMSLKAGEILDFKSLIYGLMVCSGNDAANAIAEYTSGSIPNFIQGMNNYLREIGCQNTNFTNPHGLPDPEHMTTAYDLALMTREAMKSPFFCDVVKSVRYSRPRTNKQEESILVQSNALLKQGKFYYPYAIGVKTGYTVAAGSNLIAAAEKDGRRVIAVVLNCEDMNQRYRSCISLFDTAFNEIKVKRRLFSKDHDFFSTSIEGGLQPVLSGLIRDIEFEYYPSEEVGVVADIYWDALDLPITSGQKVGHIIVKDQNQKQILKESIYSKREVNPTFSYKSKKIMNQMMMILNQNKTYIAFLLGVIILVLTFFQLGKRKIS
ncbi:MAG: D-alanyl-D-alanine carboxypeptidase [Chlamydiae bacterium]|nr:D-alanyl-D-alanine carboxypeptidase [Chlamydiota bacterium]